MPKKLEIQEVKKYIENSGCKLESKEYINNTTLLEIVCSCGKPFKKSLKVIKKNGLCKCNDCIKKEQVKNQTIPYSVIKKAYEEKGYTLLTTEENYKNTMEYSEVICPVGHSYKQIPKDFLNGRGCKKCANKIVAQKQTIPYEEIKSFFESIDYKLLTSKELYVNTQDKVTVVCDRGHETDVLYANFKMGTRCRECYSEDRGKDRIIFYDKRKKYVMSFGYDIVTPESEYINGQQEIIFKCKKGHEYPSTIHEFVSGNRCPICREPKGETEIKRILDKYKIKFTREKKIEGCKFKRYLRFDFFLPDYNLLIEYDGRQHFEIAKVFGGFDGFVDTKIRDTIKNIFCKENNFILLRIPYWEKKNIEQILIEKLKL